jgi:hypothetical protein
MCKILFLVAASNCCERSCGQKYFCRDDGSAGKILDYQASMTKVRQIWLEEGEDKDEGAGVNFISLIGQAIDMGRLDELVAVRR